MASIYLRKAQINFLNGISYELRRGTKCGNLCFWIKEQFLLIFNLVFVLVWST
jgi:hypothetical protein